MLNILKCVRQSPKKLSGPHVNNARMKNPLLIGSTFALSELISSGGYRKESDRGSMVSYYGESELIQSLKKELIQIVNKGFKKCHD